MSLPILVFKRDNDPTLLSLNCFLFILMCLFCVFLLDLCTGAVGLPLPGVEVRIVMNNASNTSIVEGNQRETRVQKKKREDESIISRQWMKNKHVTDFEFQSPNSNVQARMSIFRNNRNM